MIVNKLSWIRGSCAQSLSSRLVQASRPLFPQRPRLLRPFSTSPHRDARYPRFSPDPLKPWDVNKWDYGTKIFAGLVILSTGYYIVHLEQVPETGRWRFIDTSPQLEARLGEEVRRMTAEEYRSKILPPNHLLTQHVRRVASRLLEANDLGSLRPDRSEEFVPESGEESGLLHAQGGWQDAGRGKLREWTVFVVDEERIVNAFAAYGTIVVFTGILPICKDEHGLAAVLSHEIGHVVARHSSERYSGTKVLFAIGFLLESLGLMPSLSNLLSKLLYELPGSRRQELEADLIGLKIASKACFNPEAAIELQAGLARATRQSPVEFLSTHPGDARRIKTLMERLPEAFDIRARSPDCAGIVDRVNAFIEAAAAQQKLVEDEGMPLDSHEDKWS